MIKLINYWKKKIIDNFKKFFMKRWWRKTSRRIINALNWVNETQRERNLRKIYLSFSFSYKWPRLLLLPPQDLAYVQKTWRYKAYKYAKYKATLYELYIIKPILYFLNLIWNFIIIFLLVQFFYLLIFFCFFYQLNIFQLKLYDINFFYWWPDIFNYWKSKNFYFDFSNLLNYRSYFWQKYSVWFTLPYNIVDQKVHLKYLYLTDILNNFTNWSIYYTNNNLTVQNPILIHDQAFREFLNNQTSITGFGKKYTTEQESNLFLLRNNNNISSFPLNALTEEFNYSSKYDFNFKELKKNQNLENLYYNKMLSSHQNYSYINNFTFNSNFKIQDFLNQFFTGMKAVEYFHLKPKFIKWLLPNPVFYSNILVQDFYNNFKILNIPFISSLEVLASEYNYTQKELDTKPIHFNFMINYLLPNSTRKIVYLLYNYDLLAYWGKQPWTIRDVGQNYLQNSNEGEFLETLFDFYKNNNLKKSIQITNYLETLMTNAPDEWMQQMLHYLPLFESGKNKRYIFNFLKMRLIEAQRYGHGDLIDQIHNLNLEFWKKMSVFSNDNFYITDFDLSTKKNNALVKLLTSSPKLTEIVLKNIGQTSLLKSNQAVYKQIYNFYILENYQAEKLYNLPKSSGPEFSKYIGGFFKIYDKLPFTIHYPQFLSLTNKSIPIHVRRLPDCFGEFVNHIKCYKWDFLYSKSHYSIYSYDYPDKNLLQKEYTSLFDVKGHVLNINLKFNDGFTSEEVFFNKFLPDFYPITLFYPGGMQWSFFLQNLIGQDINYTIIFLRAILFVCFILCLIFNNFNLQKFHFIFIFCIMNLLVLLFDILNINKYLYYYICYYGFWFYTQFLEYFIKSVFSEINILNLSFYAPGKFLNLSHDIDFIENFTVYFKLYFYFFYYNFLNLGKYIIFNFIHNISYNIEKLWFMKNYFNYNLNFIYVDSISYTLILLTVLIILLCTIYLYQRKKYFMKDFIEWMVYLSFLQLGLIGAFSAHDIFSFFIFFELTLIPIYLLMLRFGSKERKIRAAYLIVLYTFFGSVFLFLNILLIFSKLGSTNYIDLLYLSNFFSLNIQFILWCFFFISFIVKIPTFPFHIWLPEAHVEAPTLGSVILAALMLKLGLYGIIKFNLLLLANITDYVRYYVYFFSLISIFLSGFVSIRQTDIKKIIAYSSIGHMNLILLGLYTLTLETFEGCIFQLFNHGLISAGLFFCIGFLYDRYYTRSFSFYGGLVIICPLTAFFFFLFILSNISFPLTNSFIAEFLIYAGMYNKSDLIVFISSLNMILVAIYSMKLYSHIFFGNFNTRLLKTKDLTYREFFILFFLIFNILLTGIFSDIFMQLLHFDIIFYIEKMKLF